jgi:hypothetical protein
MPWGFFGISWESDGTYTLTLYNQNFNILLTFWPLAISGIPFNFIGQQYRCNF